MKKLLFVMLSLILLPAFAGDYGVYDSYNYRFSQEPEEQTLFILDFSNSMTEYLDGQSKIDMMIDTVRNLLPSINPDSMVGLRVYGHKMGFTPFEACRASTLMVPITRLNTQSMNYALEKVHPKGMTPITFSLKQAIKYDFAGFRGKKHIILLTDGGENCDESPCKYAMELIKYRKDIKIDVIAFNIDNDNDLDQLECVAKVTKGALYQADTKAELVKSLNQAFKTKKEVDAKIFY